MDFLTLADTQAGGTSALKEILPWITTFVVAVVGAVLRYRGLEEGKQKGRQEERARLQGNVVIDSPIPEVTTREAPHYAESKTLDEHKSTTAEKFAAIAEDIDDLHTRINAAFKILNTLEGTVGGIESITGRLLDLAMGLPAGTSVATTRRKKTDHS